MNQVSKIAALSLIAALLTNCAPSHTHSSSQGDLAGGIVNGSEVTDQQVAPGGLANAVVGLFIKMTMTDPATQKPVEGAAVCTGTLIAPDMVLTAGHCLRGVKASDITVFIQSTSLASKNTVTAKNLQVNTGFTQDSSDSKDDVAVIQLSAPVAASAITPAALTTKDFDLMAAYKITLGYGQSDERQNTPQNRDGTGVLRVTTVNDGSQIISNGQNGQSSFPAGMIGMIIADSSVTSVCHGDSGGPLFAVDQANRRLVLAGVNDQVLPLYQGQQAADFESLMKADPKTASTEFFKKYPDAHICSGYEVFVNVADRLDWIEQTMTALRAQQ
jgi:hypothetical protein